MTAKTGPPITCHCGECIKCKRRARYSAMPPEKKEILLAKVRARCRAWRQRNPGDHRNKPRVRDPVKRKAWLLTRNAIRNGTLQRRPCEVCGGWPVEAHHEDYTKPLDVRWLCVEHHRELTYSALGWRAA